MPSATSRSLARAANEARAWLFHELLPLWVSVGRDPAGGFVEQIGLDGRPLALPKRCRVQARQIYVYAEAGRLGWTGPWREAMEDGLGFMLSHYGRDDGLMRFKVDQAGAVVDDTADNYDQAFAMFALAHAHRATGRVAYRTRADDILRALRAKRGHASGGFHESTPPAAPLRSNPHMHLLEAALAWMDLGHAPTFLRLADEIGGLAAHHFIDPDAGALREIFALDWSPAPGEAGRVTEPGHQFEWAWLLVRLAGHGVGPGIGLARRLHAHGDTFGIDAARRIAINEVAVDGSVIDASARLWPQTERMKSALVLASLEAPGSAARAAFEAQAVDAWVGLKRYAAPGRAGHFFDKCRPDGSFVHEPSYASSLYHITCAVSELIGAVGAAQ